MAGLSGGRHPVRRLSETEHVGECHKAWVSAAQSDYAEEWGRVVATSFAICFADLAAMGLLFGPPTSQLGPNVQPEPGIELKKATPPKSAAKMQAAA